MGIYAEILYFKLAICDTDTKQKPKRSENKE